MFSCETFIKIEMKKILVLFVFLSLSFQVLFAQKMFVNSSNGVNLREGPGTGYKTISNIPNGSEVDIVDSDEDWVKVEYRGKTGFVSRQYLSEDKPRTGNRSSSSSGNSSRSSNNKSNSSTAGRSTTSASAANDRSWGIGLRLGDPLGLTAKKYLASGKALEFNLGSSGYYGFDYRDDFYDRDAFRDFDYLDYDRGNSISLQAHYLFQKDFPNAKDLQWYWGFGPQLRFKSYEYYYRFRNYYGPGADDYVWEYGQKNVTNVDFGGDILIGLEYSIPGAPLSLFADANLFLEIFDNPFRFFGQGGVGIRYNFE